MLDVLTKWDRWRMLKPLFEYLAKWFNSKKQCLEAQTDTSAARV